MVRIFTFSSGSARLDTAQLDTTNHSDRCLEAFHCSSVVSGSCPIDSCPNGGHPRLLCTPIKVYGFVLPCICWQDFTILAGLF